MNRRQFVQWGSFIAAQALAGGLFIPSARAWELPGSRRRRKNVIVLGGGVAGMSTAHELMERGFEVTVYEALDLPGGKARSTEVPGTGKGGRRNLPGEHGFRFFPGYYRHVTDTMKRIPFRGQSQGVCGNLVTATRIHLANAGQDDLLLPAHLPQSLDDFELALRTLFNDPTGVSFEEREFFVRRMHLLLTSCEERRFAELENQTWWKFMKGDEFSEAYRKFMAIGFTRHLVACKAEEISARTCGTILLQLVLNILGQGEHVDRLLNGPTQDVWLNPWLDHLTRSGVNTQFGAKVEELLVAEGRISGVVIRQGARRFVAEADHYVAAVPVEVMQRLLTENLIAADPGLARIRKLRTEWMTGIQFYLSRDVRICHGHTTYLDSPWAITSISQPQFWSSYRIADDFGDGRVQGILSCDVSDWHSPGVLYGKPATECSPEELKNEVWEQIKRHLKGSSRLEDRELLGWNLDPGIVFPEERRPQNTSPLFINTVGSWQDRPEAWTKIPNLYLASDYVRTHSDLACMESANEAARRAVNAILESTGDPSERCAIWKLEEPWIFDTEKAIDRARFQNGLPHLLSC